MIKYRVFVKDGRLKEIERFFRRKIMRIWEKLSSRKGVIQYNIYK